MKRLRLCLALAASMAGTAGAGAQERMRPALTRAESDAINAVIVALEHKDCSGAAARLNAGLAQAYPGLYMLAGSMYEEGLCLKPNWERAERMYLRAQEAGHLGGRLRLIAGYAQGQRDPAAALWWAQRTPQALVPGACRPPAEAAADPERFVAAIQGWPRERLRACGYAVGVAARVIGDVDYPASALVFSVAGTVAMSFKPARATIDWETKAIELPQMLGVVDGNALLDRQSLGVQRALERHLRAVGERALKSFDPPAGVPEDWELNTTFVFTLE